MTNALNIVWFKRDLRVFDHQPLHLAATQGRVLPLYILEPELWRQADAAGRHWAFIRESLLELRVELAARGQALVVRVGEVVEVFRALHAEHQISTVWSHQETGNAYTYARDVALADWLADRGIPWHELRAFGVVRGLRKRHRWSLQWEQLMADEILPPPEALRGVPGLDLGPIPQLEDLPMRADPCPGRQIGGRVAATQLCDSFLSHRGRRFHRENSSPLSAEQAGSRLSCHLAYGTVGMREWVQRLRARRAEIAAWPAAQRGTWPRALQAQDARLHWHCHFIQKLESEPEIEFHNVNRAFDGMREPHFQASRMQAWAAGETGWPLVDACMAMLHASGWINFRMRAMLVAVAAWHLWLHWREPALHLARLFSDYEPGIHYAQIQMQSGVTGINLPRIYNPIKQALDQDPTGQFVRRWLPALQRVPDAYLQMPWRMPEAMQQQSGCRIGIDYPAPVLDHEQAAREARLRLGEWRRNSPQLREMSAEVLARHGSRRRRPATRSAAAPTPKPQGDLFADG